MINLNAIANARKEIVELKIEVKRSENKLRSFFNSSSVIHLLIDTELKLIDFNRAAANFVRKYYGIEIKEGVLVTSFMHCEHVETFMKNYAKALSGVPVRTQLRLTYGLEAIDWFFNYESARDYEGKILGMSFNAVDITEKVANEKKIVSQYHSLKEIAYIQSHNLRRPVTNIMGLVGLFKSNGYKTTKAGLLMLQKAVDELEVQMLLIEAEADK